MWAVTFILKEWTQEQRQNWFSFADKVPSDWHKPWGLAAICNTEQNCNPFYHKQKMNYIHNHFHSDCWEFYADMSGCVALSFYIMTLSFHRFSYLFWQYFASASEEVHIPVLITVRRSLSSFTETAGRQVRSLCSVACWLNRESNWTFSVFNYQTVLCRKPHWLFNSF